jgi:hypothetical protein
VNKTVQEAIAQAYPNSVWQYYQLVNVIWSSNPAQNPQTSDTVPVTLQAMLPSGINVANTTMETYAQNMTCTSCHRYATIAATPLDTAPNWSSDFSFALGNAQSPKGRVSKIIRR